MLSVWQASRKVLLISPHIRIGRPTCKRTFTESENNTDWIGVSNVQHFFMAAAISRIPSRFTGNNKHMCSRKSTYFDPTDTYLLRIQDVTPSWSTTKPSTAILQAEGSRYMKITATFSTTQRISPPRPVPEPAQVLQSFCWSKPFLLKRY